MIDPKPTDVGRVVVYRAGTPQAETGVITSFNTAFVFVRYGADNGSKATPRGELEWAHLVRDGAVKTRFRG